MSKSSQSLQEILSNLAGSWASYAALGTFLLYLFGYLSLRFHLTALGIPTDLTVVDQRYFYAGARFLVYILTFIPIIVGIALILLFVLTILIYTLAGLLALFNWIIGRRLEVRNLVPGSVSEAVQDWLHRPWVIALLGIVVAEIWIQVFLRQSFQIHDALLDPSNTRVHWVGSIMRSEDNNLEVLFFSGLVAGTAVVGGLLFLAVRMRKKVATDAMLHAREDKQSLATALIGLLAVLFAIQVLLLPVNHGVLIADKILPRVTDLGGHEKLGDKHAAWLVWEGNEGVTYLVQKGESWDSDTQRWVRVRTLITLPRKEVKRTEVVANDSIRKLLNDVTSIR